MKKIVVLFIFAFTLAISFSSCRPQKPPCPAYNTEIIIDVEIDENRA